MGTAAGECWQTPHGLEPPILLGGECLEQASWLLTGLAVAAGVLSVAWGRSGAAPFFSAHSSQAVNPHQSSPPTCRACHSWLLLLLLLPSAPSATSQHLCQWPSFPCVMLGVHVDSVSAAGLDGHRVSGVLLRSGMGSPKSAWGSGGTYFPPPHCQEEWCELCLQSPGQASPGKSCYVSFIKFCCFSALSSGRDYVVAISVQSLK